MNRWIESPVIDFDLDQPPRERYAKLSNELLTPAKVLLSEMLKDAPGMTKWMADSVRLRTANRFHAEAKELAAQVAAPWRSIVLANVSYDLTMALFGCSCAALATSDGPVLGRNMDWWPEELLARCTCKIRYLREGRVQFAVAGWPGGIGVVTGLSARGFAVALNAVSGPEGFDKLGYPVLLHLRRVLEDAESFDSALKMLESTRLAAPGLFTLVGERNDQRVVIERSPTRSALRFAKDDEPLITTNDYRMLFIEQARTDTELGRTTCRRFESLGVLCQGMTANERLDDDIVLEALADPDVILEITAQHVVMRPHERDIRVFTPARFQRESSAQA